MRNIFLLYILFIEISFKIDAQIMFNRSYEMSGNTDALSSIIFHDTSYFGHGFYRQGVNRYNMLVEFDLNGDTVRVAKYGKDSATYNTGFNLSVDGSNFITVASEYKNSLMLPYAAKINNNFDTVWTSAKWGMTTEGYFYGSVVKKDRYLFAGCLKTTTGTYIYDAFAVLTDTSGNIIWQTTFPGTYDETFYSVDTTDDGGYIFAGYSASLSTSSDIYVLKTDSMGNVLPGWPKIFSSPNGEAAFVETLHNGNYAVFGSWSFPDKQAHLRILDPSGTTVWYKNFSHVGAGAIADEFSDLVELPNGDMALSWIYYDTVISNPAGAMLMVDSLGNEKWRRKFALRTNDNYLTGIAQAPDGGFILGGFLFPDGSGNTQDSWLVKVDSMGCFSLGCSVAVEEIYENIKELIVYPNPTIGILSIEMPGFSSFKCIDLYLYDITGNNVYHESVKSAKMTIDLQYLSSGIYFLKLNFSDGLSTTKKIVLE